MKKPIPWAVKKARELAAVECDTLPLERAALKGDFDYMPPMAALVKHISQSTPDPHLVAARRIVADCYLEPGGARLGALEEDYIDGSKDTSLEVRATYRALLYEGDLS